MNDKQSLRTILAGFKAKDLIDKDSGLYKSTMYYQKSPAIPVILDGNMSVRDAASILVENYISSAPIVLEGKFMYQCF